MNSLMSLSHDDEGGTFYTNIGISVGRVPC